MKYNHYQRESLICVKAYLDSGYSYPLSAVIKGKIKELRDAETGYEFFCSGFFSSVPCSIEKSFLSSSLNPDDLYSLLIKTAIEERKIMLKGYTMHDRFQVEAIKFKGSTELEVCHYPENINGLVNKIIRSIDLSIIRIDILD